jgi:hypothetical protein
MVQQDRTTPLAAPRHTAPTHKLNAEPFDEPCIVQPKRAADQVMAQVLAHIKRARQAVRQQNIAGLIDALAAAVTTYEQHPSEVHEPTSHLRDLLVFIRLARSLCKTLKRPDDDLRDLGKRAEALRRPLH